MLLRLAITLALTSPGFAGDGPFLVTDAPIFHATEPNAAGAGEQKRTVHSPPSQDAAPQSPAVHCITVKGVDYDLAPILATRSADWTWPGGTESSLRSHLRDSHGITGIDALPFVDVRKIHAVYHEREAATVNRSVQQVTIPRAVSNCPGGVCPQPSYQATQRRGLRWFR